MTAMVLFFINPVRLLPRDPALAAPFTATAPAPLEMTNNVQNHWREECDGAV